MFNIGASELILILLVAFLIVGPKDLPKVARAIGRGVRSLKAMFDDFKSETGLDDTIEDIKDTQRDLSTTLRDIDPRTEIKQVQRDTQNILHDTQKDVKAGLKPNNPKK